MEDKHDAAPALLCDTWQVTKATTRPMAVLAGLAILSFLVAACGGVPAHNAVASIGNAKTTTTQPAPPPARAIQPLALRRPSC